MRPGPCKTAPKFSELATLLVCILIPISLSAQTTAKVHDDAYVICVDDVLAINVGKEPQISRTVPVRSDGKISLPLAGEVQASGQTPLQLEKALATKLQRFISEPEVAVTVMEVKGQKFNVLGPVSRPGTYPLIPNRVAPPGLYQPASPTVPPGTDLPLLLPWRSLHG